jgi:hypothetical protein
VARLKHSRIAIAAAALFGSAPAMADAISIVAALQPLIGGTAAAFLASNALAIAFTGFGLYRNAQARRKQRAAEASARADYNANLQDRNVTLLGAELPWQVVYGNPAPVGGAIAAMFTSGDRDEYKHFIVVFASHPCEAIDEIYIDGDAVGTLGAGGDVTGGTFYETRTDLVKTEQLDVTGGVATPSETPLQVLTADLGYTVTINGGNFSVIDADGNFPSRVNVSYRYSKGFARVNVQKHLSPGGVDTIDAYLRARCPTQYAETDKLSGYTYAVISLWLDMPRFQGGQPNFSARMRGKNTIYDFRDASTGYTTNNALCLADFIMSEPGFGARQAQIDSDAVIAAANDVDAAGFSCDGAFLTSQDREATKQQLEDSFGGTCHQSGGVWRIMAGAWASPVMTLDEDDLAGPIEIQQGAFPSRERFNTCRGTYIDGAGLGVSTDFKPWKNSAHLATDGFAKVKNVSFPFTKSHQRCQDLARMLVERSRGGLTVVVPCHMRAFPLQPGDRFALNNTEFGFASKTFRLLDWTFHPKAPIGLVATEDVAAYYDASEVITEDVAPNSVLPNPLLVSAMANFRAESGTNHLLVQADGTVITRTLLQWDASADQYVAGGGKVQLQYRLAEPDAPWQDVELPGASSSHYIVGQQDGADYLYRGRFVNELRVQSDWSTVAHTVIGKTEPPATPTRVSLTQELVFFQLGGEPDLAGARIRAIPGKVTSPSFSNGTDLIDGLVRTSPARMEQRLYGVQTVMVLAEDSSGNQSDVAYATLDFGDPNINDAVWDRSYAADSFPGAYTDCALSGGEVVADVDAGSNWYTLTNWYAQADLYATLYEPMVWQPDVLCVPYAGVVVVEATTPGANAVIEYRVSGDSTTDLYASDDWYAEDNLYGESSEWAVWPNALQVARGTALDFRVSIDGGSTRGKVSTFTASLVMEKVKQTFSNLSIAVEGTRLDPALGSPPRDWIDNIQAVYGLPFVDGSGAIALRVLDFSPVLGPLVQAVDTSGAAVAGTANVTVEGNSE